MNSADHVQKQVFSRWIRMAFTLMAALACCQTADAAGLTAVTGIINPNTGHLMLVYGYDDGTLEFRDWQGTLLQVRYGFGEVTAALSYRTGTSPLPRLFVASTDSGGALRVVDPTDINNDVASRFGFGRITAMWPYGNDCVYVGSTDSGGALRKLDSSNLTDQVGRFGFDEITFLEIGWDTVSGEYLLVSSTDSGGVLRSVHKNTLADYGPAPRFGFGRIYCFWTDDMEEDGNAEIVVASTDSGGTLRFMELPDLSTDLATRYGFGEVYDIDYNLLGMAQSNGNDKASIVVASADGGGAVRVMEVQISTLATTLGDSQTRFGFGTVREVGLWDGFQTNVNVLAVLCTNGGTCAAHITDETLTDLASFSVP